MDVVENDKGMITRLGGEEEVNVADRFSRRWLTRTVRSNIINRTLNFGCRLVATLDLGELFFVSL